MIGIRLSIPVGDSLTTVLITEKMETLRVSLRTADPVEAKHRNAAAASYFERVCQAIRADGPVTLTHKQAVALSGELYRGWADSLDKGSRISITHTPEGWVRDDDFDPEHIAAEYASAAALVGRWMDTSDIADLEVPLGPLVDRLLLRKGIGQVDQLSRQMVLTEFARALKDGFEAAKRKAEGDYTPDPKSERFPEWTSNAEAGPKAAQSITALFDAWWKEAEALGLSPSTHEAYAKAVSALTSFLGHDDATRVTPETIIAFKDHMLAQINTRTGKRLSAKTVKDSYLTGIKSVFGWAVSNRRLGSNPASAITIKLPKKVQVRESWFTREEVAAILNHALTAKRGKRQSWQEHALKRWVAWLCAYSGARLGEIVQLRKEDFRQDGKDWVMRITPEAGTVKSRKFRDVPLHRHIVEQGFVDFLTAAPEGHLFMWTGDGRAAWRTAKNRMIVFVRQVVDDPNVQPNHGWRYTFKTVGSEAGIQDRILDAICGHRPRTIGETYTAATLPAKVRAMESFPRFAII